ncbi:DUF4376 domain-containing protein [Moraxella sp. ZY200743]|uniref:DUF4376 domain-containing protein n=1 Tax=Moraxella sp. ZY200743 TaxID=2911970 RepID=UPI003D7C4146
MLQFSPSQQAFYDTSLDYQDLPNDLIEISKDEHTKLLEQINDGYYILADLSAIKRPSIHHQYTDDGWVLSIDKDQAQQEIWEAIKDKRYRMCRSGVYIKSVDKWFHSDDSSRTQYLALQTLPQLPDNLMWKTMDNSFVELNKDLLAELTITLIAEEQANFVNAEKHKAQMMQMDNPYDYDYSTGWSAIYE